MSIAAVARFPPHQAAAELQFSVAEKDVDDLPPVLRCYAAIPRSANASATAAPPLLRPDCRYVQRVARLRAGTQQRTPAFYCSQHHDIRSDTCVLAANRLRKVAAGKRYLPAFRQQQQPAVKAIQPRPYSSAALAFARKLGTAAPAKGTPPLAARPSPQCRSARAPGICAPRLPADASRGGSAHPRARSPS